MGYNEKDSNSADIQEREEFEKNVDEVRVVVGDETFQQALLKEPPRPFCKTALILYACSILGFFCSTTNGYDGSLFGTLLVNPAFKSFFGVQSVGIWPGIVTSMYQIGNVVSIPFIGPAIDTWGRRVGMFIGGFIILIGVVIQGTCVLTHSTGQFMGGRFLLGFGVGVMAAAGPCYVVELSHPAYRGIVTGLYNVFWPVGALVASGACRGGLNYNGNASWLIPIWLQAMFPGLLVLGVFLLPESPRWLYVNGKMDKAKQTLIYYHGNQNPESEWVKLQLAEYESYLELDGADKRWWDYRALFKTRSSRYRLTVNCVVSIFGQWAGNGVVTYFLSGFLDIAGIKTPDAQNNIQLGMNAIQIAVAITGALFVDKLGRRPLLIWTNIACCVCWIGVTVSTANQASTQSTASSKACLAMVYLFQAVFSFGWTPLQALYPVEVLSFEMRAKGMAFSSFAVAAGGMVNQFGFPVALQNIQWRTYIVFCVWCAIQAAIIYLIVPETKNRTLEELDEIFKAKNPRKASTQKKELAIDENANVIGVATI